ncbi:MAG: DAK2 domain-containing protein [Atopobiaceae bacterium]|nr:DAK2 domain-containing protein [Atopobiaceae bacterium]
MITDVIRSCFPLAAQAVADKAEEINKLNVFPVPDGDTGTNMSLTLGTVVKEVEALRADASMNDIAKAITHGSLMGARGNSGVITSQILRGVAEGLCDAKGKDATTSDIAHALRRGVKVAFQAVRKPVEGTILTVLKDISTKADWCEKKKLSVDECLDTIVVAAYESVARTPDLLPVLKENGVVDSGAFGLATFIDGFVNAYMGKDSTAFSNFKTTAETPDQAKDVVASRVDIEINDDWEGSEYRYCTEFLFHANEGFDRDASLTFLTTMGDCELLVGAQPDYKVHVHTNEPHRILEHMLERGQIFEVYIHNMDLEAQERTEKIAADKDKAPEEPERNLGFVAVASGAGQTEILSSLGVDVIVSGGQTMNPSTADILAAIEQVNARSVIVMPGNSNIVMAAEAAAGACDSKEVRVVKAKSVPQEFSAMFAVDLEASLEENVELMNEAITLVRDGEVTQAVRDSAAADGSPIHEGDIMGIASGEIEVVGSAVDEVCIKLINKMQAEEEGDTLTILAGSDLDDEAFNKILEAIKEEQPDIEIDPHRGEQPLYPIIFSIE